MKKLNKFLYWSICVGSILIGGILLSVGVSLGGATSFSIGVGGLNFYKNSSFSSDDIKKSVINEHITAIDMELEFTEVVIKSGDTLSINHTSDIAYRIQNNTLEITSTHSKSNKFGMYLGSASRSLVEITVPNNMTSLEVETSSKTTLDNISFDKIELDIALGDTLIQNICANIVEIDADLGNITLNSCSFYNLDAELNMGNLTTSNLEILTHAKFENDMGSLDINLSGSESDYNFINSVDLGSFSVNGNKKPSFYGLIDIFTETSMGSVKITTK